MRTTIRAAAAAIALGMILAGGGATTSAGAHGEGDRDAKGRGRSQRPSRDAAVAAVIRGGYVNDASCIPTAPPESRDGVTHFECAISSLWNGDLTGRTFGRFVGTVDPDFTVSGTYTETFVGRYTRDGSYGSLLFEGVFEVDEHGQFVARAQIVGGSCAWAGSTGSANYDGYQLNGGWVARWVRDAALEDHDPTCNPLSVPA